MVGFEGGVRSWGVGWREDAGTKAGGVETGHTYHTSPVFIEREGRGRKRGRGEIGRIFQGFPIEREVGETQEREGGG